MVSPDSSAEEDQPSSTASLTPATTISPPSEHIARITNNDASPSSERLDSGHFVSNLSHYLALGCLLLPSASCASTHHAERAPPSWQDVTHPLPSPGLNSVLSGQVTKLAAAEWIRIRYMSDRDFVIYRVYILPADVGLRYIDRQNKRLWAALEALIGAIDIDPELWAGRYTPEQHRHQHFDRWAARDGGSLFYMFNKLPSPAPSPRHFHCTKDKYIREAMEDLLEGKWFIGLKSTLYPYQRRSAALMLQRESLSTLQPDPRIEPRTAPDGTPFFYSARDMSFLREPRYYEACRGGILAETMGLGKTLICLALIVATRHHLPKVPTDYGLSPDRPTTANLFDMALAKVNRNSIPWKVELERMQSYGCDLDALRARMDANPPMYEIPVEPLRWNRGTALPPPKKMVLAPTTIIVVPRNLCKQWQSELAKHIVGDALRVLVMEDLRKPLPPADELRTYDVVLFSRTRFELEIKDGSDTQGRRVPTAQATLVCRCPYIGATRERDCHCLKMNDLYDSPLKNLHFKRLIIDEGHFFSAKNTTAVAVANKLVAADHRWVVSGTPAKDLLGVEVDMTASENLWQTPETPELREAVLDQRQAFNLKDDTSDAIKSLGALASSFLRIRPWCSFGTPERPAVWEDCIYRHEDPRRRTFSGYSSSLRRTIEAMVVKTRPEDVERDIELPPLTHEVVYLEPSFFDKLTVNLFTLVLTANAVTSERTDADYLFHKNSQKARSQLIANLRQSAFFWTGFSEDDVLATLKNSIGYLAKDNTKCTDQDRRLLTEALKSADVILNSKGWKFLSQSHELGLYVKAWPAESAEFWAGDESTRPLLIGMSQLLEAQKHVNEKVASDCDPGEGLAGAGIKSLAAARRGDGNGSSGESKPILAKTGVPTSSLNGEPVLKRRTSFSKSGVRSPNKRKSVDSQKEAAKERSSVREGYNAKVNGFSTDSLPDTPTTPKRKRTFGEARMTGLAEDSPFAQARIIGTTSAKLSYLASQILKHYRDEKILIFYDGDNVAYYIAQMLEVLHIKHEIYAKSLAANLKSEYVVRFDQEDQDRVLLMDVKQAAFGLNLSSASRIYFVNPVCRPNIEAQAIKRAHRIGQTRKVYVETLVLRGTIEEKMYERAKRMTRSEHLDAKMLEDDGGITEIIQSARTLPVNVDEDTAVGQMAPLEEPQRLWCRPGWKDAYQRERVAQATFSAKRRKTSGAAVKFEKAATSSPAAAIEASDEDQAASRRERPTAQQTNVISPPTSAGAPMFDQ